MKTSWWIIAIESGISLFLLTLGLYSARPFSSWGAGFASGLAFQMFVGNMAWNAVYGRH